MTRSGYDIAMSVDPNTSDDVCTFCRHGQWQANGLDITCALGFSSYFRSLSQYGPIFVSDCGRGEMREAFAAIDKTKGAQEP